MKNTFWSSPPSLSTKSKFSSLNSTLYRTSSDSTRQLLVDSIYHIKCNRKEKSIQSAKHRIKLEKKKQTINQLHITNLKENCKLSLMVLKQNLLDSSSSSRSCKNLPNIPNTRYEKQSKMSYDLRRQFMYDMKNVRHFTNSVKEIALYKNCMRQLKNFAEEKEEDLNRKYEEMDNKIRELKEKNEDLLYNVIPRYDRYILFLRGERRKEEEINEGIKSKEEMVKKEIEIINNKIFKVKSLFEGYLKYRNILICFKENIIKLPEQFEQVNVTNHDNIPLHLVKYLKLDCKIFTSTEEFIRKIKFKEDNILKLNSQRESINKEVELLKEELNQLQLEYDIKNKKVSFYEQDIEKVSNNQLKYKLLNEKYNKSYKDYMTLPKRSLKKYIIKIPFDLPVEVSMMILELQHLYEEKQFTIENAYVFYYIYKNMNSLYKSYPSVLSFKTVNHQNFILMLKELEYPERVKQSKLRDSALALLTLYEDAVNNMLCLHRERLMDEKTQRKLIEIMNVYKTNKSVMNMRNQRMLFERKRQQKRKELDEKTNKPMYKSYSSLFANYRQKKKKIKINNVYNDVVPITYNDLFLYQNFLD